MRPSNGLVPAEWRGCVLLPAGKDGVSQHTGSVPAYRHLVSAENLLIFKMPVMNPEMRARGSEKRSSLSWLLSSPSLSLWLTPWVSQQLCHALFASTTTVFTSEEGVPVYTTRGRRIPAKAFLSV